ncbi:hypothetical protein IWW43_005522, partial [Coemansia sp. RSA 1935]
RQRQARRRRISALCLLTLAGCWLARAMPTPTLQSVWRPSATMAPTLLSCATGSWLPSS